MAVTMLSQNAIHGGQGECFVTIAGVRRNFMSLKDFEATAEHNLAEVPVLGQTYTAHKVAGASISWSGTAHYNQSELRTVMDVYQKTGVMPYMEIQITNWDKTSTVGRQTIILRGVLFDSVILTKLTAGEELLDEDMSGTANSWDMPEKFITMPGV